MSSGKLATYVLPCFPAYAVLIAWGLVRYAETGKTFREADWALRILFRCLLPALVVLFAVQAFNLFVPGKIPQHYLLFWRGENFFLPVIALMVFLLWIWMAKEAREPVYKFTCVCVAVGFAALAYPVSIPHHLVREIAPVDFLARNAREIPDSRHADSGRRPHGGCPLHGRSAAPISASTTRRGNSLTVSTARKGRGDFIRKTLWRSWSGRRSGRFSL